MVNLDSSMEQSSVSEVLKSLGIAVNYIDKKYDYFMTVITRTQGVRPYLLKETMLCLMAQECDDFEWLITAHKVDSDSLQQIRDMLNQSPVSFNSRVRILSIEEGNRTQPLNIGFKEARGKYVSILDDDDIVLAHWVSEFLAMSRQNSGKVLRTMPLWQGCEVLKSPESDQYASCSVESPVHGTAEYDFWKHFYFNESPIHCMAFPSNAFQGWGINFDENLSFTEDWDFLLRMVSVCGICSSAVPTSIYRKFRNLSNSNTEHNYRERIKCSKLILENINKHRLIVPPGNVFWKNRSRENILKLFKTAIYVLRHEGLASFFLRMRSKLKVKGDFAGEKNC